MLGTETTRPLRYGSKVERDVEAGERGHGALDPLGSCMRVLPVARSRIILFTATTLPTVWASREPATGGCPGRRRSSLVSQHLVNTNIPGAGILVYNIPVYAMVQSAEGFV